MEVDESALQDHQLNSVADIMQILFDLEDAGMLIPVYIPEWDIYTVRIKNSLLRDAVKSWVENSISRTMQEITPDAYNLWKLLFPSEAHNKADQNECQPAADTKVNSRGRIIDFPYYILVTLLQLRQILTKNTKELEEFIITYGDRKVTRQYDALINNSLGMIDTELGRIIEYAKVIEPVDEKTPQSTSAPSSDDSNDEK